MNTIEHDPKTDMKPCVECPFVLKHWILLPRCSKSIYLDPVTGKVYQTCQQVRGRSGGMTIHGEYQQCLGYSASKNATVSRKIEKTC